MDCTEHQKTRQVTCSTTLTLCNTCCSTHYNLPEGTIAEVLPPALCDQSTFPTSKAIHSILATVMQFTHVTSQQTVATRDSCSSYWPLVDITPISLDGSLVIIPLAGVGARQLGSSRPLSWYPAWSWILLDLFFVISWIPAGSLAGSAHHQPGDLDPIPGWYPAGGELVV
ncbi:hypothetical protein BJ322DRAFT_1025344 [Thelephora terrestris]|uniref:Uncharacterized protein n=1 Tax=Thelephora terrestris TaxID=56493 RepID=A0A9P6L1N9_9AGAM|nr:hypothetical protein BJ322DRAFT_1025344 [Thelephora terrestris]